MSTIKVDTIATRTGSGNITLSNNVASLTSAGAISGTNLSASGTLAVTGNTTVGGTLVNTGLITASAGVAIGGTGSANTLDDYEEGTWTPVAAGESTAGTYTNSYRIGRYIKVGLQVYVSGVLHGSIASSAGAAQVQGLPFAKDSNDTGLATVQWNSMPFNSLGEEDHQTIGLVDSSHIHFRANDRRVNETHTQLTWSNGNITYLRFSAVYRTT